jgi:hypothetical protein
MSLAWPRNRERLDVAEEKVGVNVEVWENDFIPKVEKYWRGAC